MNVASLVLKGSRVAQIDAKCIASGIDSKWLMQNAGKAVADVILRDIKDIKDAISAINKDTSKETNKDIKYKINKIDTINLDVADLAKSPLISIAIGIFKGFLNGVIVCGSGNNGGDGFVAAIELINFFSKSVYKNSKNSFKKDNPKESKDYKAENLQTKDADSTDRASLEQKCEQDNQQFFNQQFFKDLKLNLKIFYLNPIEKFTEDTRYYFDKLSQLLKTNLKKVEASISYLDYDDKKQRESFINSIKSADFIVDAIFGTGLHGKEIYGNARRIIEEINSINDKIKFDNQANINHKTNQAKPNYKNNQPSTNNNTNQSSIINLIKENQITSDTNFNDTHFNDTSFNDIHLNDTNFNDTHLNNTHFKKLVYSVDIPSGIDSDNGKILGTAIKADKTITFGCKKFGLVVYPGKEYAGKLIVADIGIPKEYFLQYEKYFEIDLNLVISKIPYKSPYTYKHAVGKLLVVAGSLGYTGAASMTCLAALRAGAGIVTLVCPWELNSIFEVKLTEVMTYPVEQTDDITLHLDSFGEIEELSLNFDALAIGPGISRNPSTICLVREILKNIKKPTVLDADGLRALYGPMNLEQENNLDLSHVVITPHSGELAAILGIEKIRLEERLDRNLEVVKKFGFVSVLKGASTLVTEPSGQTYINPTGTWALATAGTGDILTGIIGALLAQGLSLVDAAVAGVFIHGLASDIMVQKTSKTSQIATDLLDGLKEVFLQIEKIKY